MSEELRRGREEGCLVVKDDDLVELIVFKGTASLTRKSSVEL